MTKQEKRAYFEAIQVRYRRASKSRKTTILNEFCEVCGYHRKYALRLLNTPRYKRKRIVHKSGPVSRYNTPELLTALRSIWMASDQLCSKRLKEALPLWLPHYESTFQALPEGAQTTTHMLSKKTGRAYGNYSAMTASPIPGWSG